MTYPKLCIGPVSQNLIEAMIDVAIDTNTVLGMVPSNNQIGQYNGYVGHTNNTLLHYIKLNTRNIFIQRDHGDPVENLDECAYYDSIHIDPFRNVINIEEAAKITADFINSTKYVQFEIGTEDSVFPYSVKEFGLFLQLVREQTNKFLYVKSAVVQGNTFVHNGGNQEVNLSRLRDMIDVAHYYGVMPKIHNADYLSDDLIRFVSENYGPVSWNFAPEFGSLESEIVMQYLSPYDLAMWASHIKEIAPWQKWWTKTPTVEELILTCGHYTFNTIWTKKLLYNSGVSKKGIQHVLKHNIKTLLELTK